MDSQSRIGLDFEELRKAGWTIITHEEKCFSSERKVFFHYVDPAGKTVKSSSEAIERGGDIRKV